MLYNQGMDRLRLPAISRLTKKRVLILLILLLLLYIVVPQVGAFSDSFTVLGQASPLYVALAAVLTAATYIVAAAMYWQLALRRLGYRQTLAIQIASGFTNRLLPGGLGTVTLYVQYLRHFGHNVPQAVAVAGSNNLLGILGHSILLCLVLVITPDKYPAALEISPAHTLWLALGIGLAGTAISLLVFRKLRRHIYRMIKEVVTTILLYRKRPAKLAAAGLFSCVLTLLYVTIFYCCTIAVGLEVGLVHVFLVFTVGMIVGTATPTPGGLLGAEAGLTGGLIAYGAEADAALAAALLYRFLTYWLPLLPGFIVFIKVRRLYS